MKLVSYNFLKCICYETSVTDAKTVHINTDCSPQPLWSWIITKVHKLVTTLSAPLYLQFIYILNS